MLSDEFLTPSEQLTAFLDGELSQGECSSLFMQMAHDSDLQKEMKDLVSIRNAFRNSAVVPPDNLKHKIMIGTGLESPSFLNIIKAGMSPATATLSLVFNKYTMMSLLFLVIASSSWFLIQNKGTMNKNLTDNGSDKKVQNIAKMYSFESSKNHGNADKNITSENSIAVEQNKHNSVKKHEKRNQFFTLNNTDLPAQNEVSAEVENTVISEISDSKPQFNNAVFNTRNYLNPSWIVLPKGLMRLFDNFTVNLKMNNGYSTPNVSFNDKNAPLLNNYSVAFLYNLNSSNALGLEIGYENYPMVFEGTENDILVRYSQSFNGFWVGATFQHVLKELYEDASLQPYVNLSLGANQVGALSKLGLGFKYMINENFTVNPGIDYGLFIYQNQGNYFSTSKVNFNIGLGVSL